MQHPVTAQESGLAGTVLTHEQRDGPQATTMFALKAAYVLHNQLSRIVHDEILPDVLGTPSILVMESKAIQKPQSLSTVSP